MKSVIIFIAFTFSIFNANALTGVLITVIANSINVIKKEESINPESVNTKQSGIGNDKSSTKNPDSLLLTEEEIISKRAYQIRRLSGANITQLKKQIEAAFADMGFSTFGWLSDNQYLSQMTSGHAMGKDYRVFIYVRKLGDSYIMRLAIRQHAHSTEPDISDQTYSAIWDQLGTSNFVDKIRIDPRALQ